MHRPPLPFDNSTHHTKAIIAEVRTIVFLTRGLRSVPTAFLTCRNSSPGRFTLQYADGLRVIIPTSNFTHSDLTSKTQAM